MDRIKYCSLAFLGLLVFARPTQAADQQNGTLRLVGTTGLVRTGEIVPIQIQLDSVGFKVNAVEVQLEYQAEQLQAIYATREQSVMTLWPEAPSWSTPGVIHLSGGRPGGLYASNAAIATIYFRARSSGAFTLSINAAKTAAYLHDGLGTRLPLTMEQTTLDVASDLVPGLELISTTHPTPEFWSHGHEAHIGWSVEAGTEYSYLFGQDPFATPDDTPEKELGSVEYRELEDGIYYFTIKSRARGGFWSPVIQRRFLIDGTAPDAFSIQLLPPSTVGGQHVIAWQAADALSGIAETHARVGGKEVGIVQSPMVVRKEWRGQKIVITVSDLAGNIASATWNDPAASIQLPLGWLMAGLGLAIVAGGVTLVALRRRRM